MIAAQVDSVTLVDHIGNQIVLIIGALITLIGVGTQLVIAWRTKKTVEQVHDQVNGNFNAQVARSQQLTTLLSTTDVEIPPAPEGSSDGKPSV